MTSRTALHQLEMPSCVGVQVQLRHRVALFIPCTAQLGRTSDQNNLSPATHAAFNALCNQDASEPDPSRTPQTPPSASGAGLEIIFLFFRQSRTHHATTTMNSPPLACPGAINPQVPCSQSNLRILPRPEQTDCPCGSLSVIEMVEGQSPATCSGHAHRQDLFSA